MTVALVTGAARGIGREVAAGLAARGVETIIGARSEERARAVAAELTGGARVHGLHVDVTDERSVAVAAAWIAATVGRLDILVNNAGVLLDKRVPPSALPVELLRSTYDVNVVGVVRVTNAVLPLLRRSPLPTIVNVSSAMGSLTLATDETWEYHSLLQAAYNSSKAALNALTIQYAKELAGAGVRVNAVHPGVCATDLNGQQGPRSAAEGAAVIIHHATRPAGGPTGGFFDEDGPLPW